MTAENIYQQLHEEVDQAIKSLGLDLDIQSELSEKITARLRRLLGGDTVYFPLSSNRKERYAAIKKDFNGSNQNELCKKYGVSRSTVLRAIK